MTFTKFVRPSISRPINDFPVCDKVCYLCNDLKKIGKTFFCDDGKIRQFSACLRTGEKFNAIVGVHNDTIRNEVLRV